LIKLVARFPAVPDYKENLASAHNELGLLLKDVGKGDEAGVEYLAAIRIKKQLAEQFPAVPGYQVGLGGSYGNYAGLIRSEGKPVDSLEWFDLAVRALKAIPDGGRAGGTAKLYLRNTYWGRAKAYDELQRFGEAVADREQAVNLSRPADQPGFRASRANSRLRAGQTVYAVAEVVQLKKTPTWNAGQWYDFACIYAIASGRISDKKQAYADRAMELLGQAVKCGYTNAAHLATDVDLDSLHPRDDFKALV
jgi:tetratricopeptide (TPR) repeat protein